MKASCLKPTENYIIRFDAEDPVCDIYVLLLMMLFSLLRARFCGREGGSETKHFSPAAGERGAEGGD